MTREEFIALFPRKGIITQEIIDTADIINSSSCIGATTLKASLGEDIVKQLRPSIWGDAIGYLQNREENWIPVEISTRGRIRMTKVTGPMEVEFVVED